MAKRLGWYVPEQMVFKITLADSVPKIWRLVEVHSGLTLHDLHFVIQNVYEWDDSHLYHFLVPPGGKLTQRAMREATRYDVLPPDAIFGEGQKNDGRADEVMLGRIFNQGVNQIVYEYDFGDSWEHIIKLEKRTGGGDHDHVPVCLAGENAAPLDDMGGIFGYYQWIEALLDQTDDMHDDAVDWLGEDFDPARFHLSATNKRLSAAFKPAPSKPRKSRKERDQS